LISDISDILLMCQEKTFRIALFDSHRIKIACLTRNLSEYQKILHLWVVCLTSAPPPPQPSVSPDARTTTRHYLTVYPFPSRQAARAFWKAACCCWTASCCCCVACWEAAIFCLRLWLRPATAPAAAPVLASSATTSPTTAPRAAPFTPAPGLLPVAVVGGLAASIESSPPL